MKTYTNWYETVSGKRNADKVAKAFNAQGLETRVDRLMGRVGTETPRPSNQYMVIVKNPGERFQLFNDKCTRIFRESMQ